MVPSRIWLQPCLICQVRALKGERGILRGAFRGDAAGAPMRPRSLPAGDRAKGLSAEPAVLNLRQHGTATKPQPHGLVTSTVLTSRIDWRNRF